MMRLLVEAGYVKAAALRYKGKVYTGLGHIQAAQKAVDDGAIEDVMDLFLKDGPRGEEGFIDHQGNFLTRSEAKRLARQADQVQPGSYQNRFPELDSIELRKKSGGYSRGFTGEALLESVGLLIEAGYVKAAAIRFKGKVYTGHDHADAVHSMVKAGTLGDFEDYFEVSQRDKEEGFLNHQDRFITREQAKKLAREADQFTPNSFAANSTKWLDSEDIKANDPRYVGESFDLLVEAGYVKAAAIRFKGKVYPGFFHIDAVHDLVAAGHFKNTDDYYDDPKGAEEGFLTHDDEFVDREEAKKIANQAGQTDAEHPQTHEWRWLDSTEIKTNDKHYTGESANALIARQLLEGDDDYRGNHQAPGPDSAPMHDLTGNGVYPDDVYTTPHYYFYSDEPHERESFRRAERVRGKPDKDVMIYRAVPKGVKTFNPGDWVTPSKAYARQHSRHPTDSSQDMHIIRTWAKAKDLHTNGDSISEWGYNGPAAKTGDVVFRPRKPLTQEQKDARNLRRRMASSERRRQANSGGRWAM